MVSMDWHVFQSGQRRCLWSQVTGWLYLTCLEPWTIQASPMFSLSFSIFIFPNARGFFLPIWLIKNDFFQLIKENRVKTIQMRQNPLQQWHQGHTHSQHNIVRPTLARGVTNITKACRPHVHKQTMSHHFFTKAWGFEFFSVASIVDGQLGQEE